MTTLTITADALRALAEPTLREKLAAELDRLNRAANAGPVHSVVIHGEMSGELAKVGDDGYQIWVDAEQALAALTALPDGAQLGTESPDKGTVWHVLNACEM